jgi:Holliday junction resolvase-like predicted endonuclease
MSKIAQYHVGVAAEAFAAALFARASLDVSVQYGANQPEYDLMVARKDKMLKVSVKGSQDGSWGLTQTHLARIKQANYHGAIDLWLEQHWHRTVFCFVQFRGVSIDSLPRVYIATPSEIAKRLKQTAKGRGDTILYEEKRWTARAYAAGTTDRIPDEWRFSLERIDQLLKLA